MVKLIIAFILMLCPVLQATNMTIIATTGRPHDVLKSKWYSGDCFDPCLYDGVPAWQSATSTPPTYQIWNKDDDHGEALLLTFAAIYTNANTAQWVAMLCPNADPNGTNNEFVIVDQNRTGSLIGGTTVEASEWHPERGSYISNVWSHYAVAYTPRTGVLTWWQNGARRGETNAGTRQWSGPWQTGSVAVLTFGATLGSWQPGVIMDRLSVKLSNQDVQDLDVWRDYLAWKVARFGVTVDDPFTLAFNVIGIPLTVPDYSTVTTNQDAVLIDNAWDVTRFDKRVDVAVSRGAATFGYQVDNGYSVSPCGLVSNTESGTAIVTVTATNDGAKDFSRAFAVPVELTETAESNQVYRTGVSGSLRGNMADWINARVGKGQRSQWTTYNPTATNYQRSTNVWTVGAVGIEAASVWSSRHNSGGVSPTLVAPDLALGCAHALHSPGTVIRWVSTNNAVIESTVQASTQVGTWDVSLMRISPAVTGIPFAQIIATNATTRFDTAFGLPVVKLSQTGRVDTLDVAAIDGYASYGQSADTNRAAYYAPLQYLDSGNPCFWIINGTATVANVWTTFTQGAFLGGIPDSSFAAAAVAVGSTNRITRMNVNSFTEYP